MNSLDESLANTPIPRNEGGPVFDEPWQAQAFALTLKLHESGHFTWPEWAQIFGGEIDVASQAGRGCGNEDYYLCWLAALEKMLLTKNIVTTEQMLSRKAAWEHANEHTDHGQPIVLER